MTNLWVLVCSSNDLYVKVFNDLYVKMIVMTDNYEGFEDL